MIEGLSGLAAERIAFTIALDLRSTAAGHSAFCTFETKRKKRSSVINQEIFARDRTAHIIPFDRLVFRGRGLDGVNQIVNNL